jgi:tetratricopeptide (TPR) repeat protein
MTSPTTPSGSPEDRAKQVEHLLEQVDRQIENGNFDVALDLIRRAQGLDAENHYALAFVGRIQRLMGARKGRGGSPKPGSAYAPTAFLKNEPGPPAPPTAAAHPSDARKAALQSAIAHIITRAREYSSARNFERALAEVERARLLDASNPEIERLEGEIRREMEDDRARMTEEQRRRQEEEESRKREAIEQEITRIRKEKEERRSREEEARKQAQDERIRQYLRSAETLIAAGKLDEAANQLAFVVVIDPLNGAAAELQRRSREITEQKRQEEAEQRRRKEEETQQRQAALQLAIRKNLESATVLADERKFNDALRVITRAYVLDPVNAEVRACEQRILTMQEEEYRRAQAEKRAVEEGLRLAQEEELRRLTESERERLLKEQDEVLEEEQRANREKIARHLARAREHLAARSFQDALAEVAQAFAIDPFDEDLRRTEQEIMSAQQAIAAEIPPSSPETDANGGQDEAAELNEHLESARRLRAQGEFTRALDELTKAFLIDPLNPTVQELQTSVESEMRGDLPSAAPPPTPQPEGPKPADVQKIMFHIVRARKMMEGGAYEDAMAEVALGLMLDAENSDLLQMESTLWELQTPPPAGNSSTTREENERLIRIHLAAADQFRAKGEFGRALDEIAKAYQIDPLYIVTKQKENEIRQEEMRRTHPGETNLKLVYPRKGAAGA